MANEKKAPSRSKITSVDLFNAYVEFMKMMIGNLFILCAGSAAALLTFAGSKMLDDQQLITEAGLKNAIVAFGIGAMLSVASAGLVALQENWNSSKLDKDSEAKLEWRIGLCGGLLMAGAGIAFAAGCWLATIK